MANPAQKLAAVLSGWEISRGESAESARRQAGVGDLEFWRSQAEVVNLVQETDAQLRAMRDSGDDIGMYEASLIAWYQAVFAYKSSWTSSHSSGTVALSADPMSMLRGLGLLLSKVGQKGEGSPTRRQSLLGCLEDAMHVLEEELADWDSDEKAYIYSIIAAARKAIEQDGLLGERDIRSLINELMGVLTGIALDLRAAEGKDSTRWMKIMDVVGKTGTTLRGIVHDAEALTSLAVSVGVIASASGHQ